MAYTAWGQGHDMARRHRLNDVDRPAGCEGGEGDDMNNHGRALMKRERGFPGGDFDHPVSAKISNAVGGGGRENEGAAQLADVEGYLPPEFRP